MYILNNKKVTLLKKMKILARVKIWLILSKTRGKLNKERFLSVRIRPALAKLISYYNFCNINENPKRITSTETNTTTKRTPNTEPPRTGIF